MSKVVLDSHGLALISSSIIGAAKWNGVTAIGGPAYGAIPIVSGVLTIMNISWPMKGFFVRKETKEYGKKELIEGHLTKDDNVVLLEDVTTTGGSLLRAVEEVQKIATVRQVITIVDRNQGADKLFEAKGIPFTAILNINQIL
jgi:orotate phosphoribosyltransferase